MSFRNLGLIGTLLLIVACSPSAEDRVKGAQAALDASDFAKAQTESEAALKEPSVTKDAKSVARLEIIRLQALAQTGNGKEVLSSLERLNGSMPAATPASLYRELGDKLRAAKDTSGAIDVLNAGDKRFPAEHQSFVDAIEAIKNAGIDPAEVEKLKALGYL